VGRAVRGEILTDSIIPLDNKVLQEALSCARRGWRIIPVKEKRPLLQNWTKQGATDEKIIKDWFHTWPGCNYGIVTGRVSGIIVLDIDGDIGAASLQGLETDYERLPDTPKVLTGGGGRHIYFEYPENIKIGNRTGLLPGIDIRGDGGMVVGPGSVHISGRCYEWELFCSIEEIQLSKMPDWLIALINKPKQTAATALQEVAMQESEPIYEGSRNATLTKIAGSLRRQALDENEIFEVLGKINDRRCVPPLGDKELQAIARSVARYAPDVITAAQAFGSEEWSEPLPLGDDRLFSVDSLSDHIIPSPFRPWLTDISYRMQCPLDFVAVGAIVAASAVIGAGCAIRPKKNDDWSVIPNLWGAIIGRPSMLKTPSLAEIMKPFSKMEAASKEEFEAQNAFYMAEVEGFKAQREAIKSKMLKQAKSGGELVGLQNEFAELGVSQPPVRRRFKTNDSTVEKLSELLNENPRGLLVFRDELTGLLASWEREDRQADRSFYLEAWNGGQGFTTDRIGRGTIDVGNCCLSILGGIQPTKLTEYLLKSTQGIGNDGMLQRFQLLVYPDEPTGWQLVDQMPDDVAKDKAFSIMQTLAELDFVQAGASPDDNRPYFRFNDAGQDVFYRWLTELENKIRVEDSPLITEHLAKYRSLMPSLALIFHLIESAANSISGHVSGEAAEMAVAWCSYLESHARRIYGMSGNRNDKATTALAKKIEEGKIKDNFTLRDIYRNGWSMLDNHQLIEEACQELESLNWLREVTKQNTGGRPKTSFLINPKIPHQSAESEPTKLTKAK